MAKKPFVVNSRGVRKDREYLRLIRELKELFERARIKSALKANKELLSFYWQLGRELVRTKAEEKWGKGVIDQISQDLQIAFPGTKGFSVRNLRYMNKWYSFYSICPDPEKLMEGSNPDSDEEGKKLLAPAAEQFHQVGEKLEKDPIVSEEKPLKNDEKTMHSEKLHQAGGEIEMPDIFALVPWGHHIEIITRCKDASEALFYIEHAAKEGWSRKTLISKISGDLYRRAGSIQSNFADSLPEPMSEIAQDIMKDTYDLSFASLPKKYKEGQLETAIEQNITRFLLELGTGFAFMGRQREIVVDGRSRRMDMLFYHVKLKCYVVVELKVVPFEPEFIGKLNFYVNAVDELIKGEGDNPTIGLLICKDAGGTEVKWSIRRMATPIGVASYKGIREKEIEAALPSEEEIKTRLEQAEEEYLTNVVKDEAPGD